MGNGKENNFNYNTIYYKVTSEEECHHGYQYRDGLNILNEKFNSDPKKSCVRGGFYFTDYKNLPDYFIYGIYIREIKIPLDAHVVKNPTGNKWRADKIIFGKKYRIKEDFNAWFNKDKFNYKNYSYILVKNYHDKFDLWFDAKKFNYELSPYLAKFCSDKFDQWFDSEKYNWRYGLYDLVEYCSDKFEQWFDPKKFDFADENAYHYLEKFCSKYKHIWGQYI